VSFYIIALTTYRGADVFDPHGDVTQLDVELITLIYGGQHYDTGQSGVGSIKDDDDDMRKEGRDEGRVGDSSPRTTSLFRRLSNTSLVQECCLP
jgi:hypothetical protein